MTTRSNNGLPVYHNMGQRPNDDMIHELHWDEFKGVEGHHR